MILELDATVTFQESSKSRLDRLMHDHPLLINTLKVCFTMKDSKNTQKGVLVGDVFLRQAPNRGSALGIRN